MRDNDEDEPSHRPCGCPLDYHLADCSITHPPSYVDDPYDYD